MHQLAQQDDAWCATQQDRCSGASLAASSGKPCSSSSRASGCSRGIFAAGIFTHSYRKRPWSIGANVNFKLLLLRVDCAVGILEMSLYGCYEFSNRHGNRHLRLVRWLHAAHVSLKAAVS